jgi:hypothetical protein
MIQSIFRGFFGVGTIALMVVGCNSSAPKPESSGSPMPIASATPSTQPSTKPSAATLKPKPGESTSETQGAEATTKGTTKGTKEPSSEPAKVAASSGSTVPVAIYRMDASCDALVPKTENLPKDRTLEAAVGAVISRNNSADFTVSDYRVSQAGGKATIVLRLPPTAKRPFAAMSACEQMSLFGALRETIVSRSEWKIRDVQFTDGKEEIVF